ncbi:MAG: PAS domain-containing sensor histidine kinase [Pseudomonadota bacterium]|nr:PAS domain-containing sensor histidine kinase [Pseudomonadota bacterium]
MDKLHLTEQHTYTELETHIKNSAPIYNAVNKVLFVILTPSLHVLWVSDLVKTSYNSLIQVDLNTSDLGEFEEILDQLRNSPHFPKHFETKDPTRPKETIAWSASLLEGQQKQTMGIVLVGKININESILYQRKIDFLQNCLDTIVDNVPGNVYWKDKEGVYLGCNNTMVVQSNLKSKLSIIGKTDKELWPENADEVSKRDLEVMTNNKTIEFQETVKINSGENLYFISIKTPLRDEDKNVIGVVGNSMDITEIVRSKEKAEEANNIKTQFLLNMQHDIKTPISHIIGLTEILMTSKDVSTKVKEYLGYINTSSKRLMELITDILRFADIEAGNVAKRESHFNLIDMVKKTVELNAVAVQQKHIDVVQQYDPSISYDFMGDSDRLHRVLLNLFDNALKFIEKGSITISSRALETLPDNRILLEICVEDTGIGIPEEKHVVIFDRFSRLSPSSSNKYPGFGLGLWMVKKFIEEMDGTVTLTSRIGKGSKFCCIIPLGVRNNEH